MNIRQLFKRFGIAPNAQKGVIGLIAFLAKYPQVMTTISRASGLGENITKDSEIRKIIRSELTHVQIKIKGEDDE